MNRRHSPPEDFDEDALPADDFEVDDRPPSKSQRKRDSHELQNLGDRLLAMPDARLAQIEMSERLRDALAAWKTTRSFEGKRRQMQYIGKVLRLEETEHLREAVASFDLGQAHDSLSLHEAERWRAELVSDDKDALGRWAEAYPDDDLQKVRNLVRNARKDASLDPEKRSGKAYRELFQHIKAVLKDEQAARKAASAAAPQDDHDDDHDDA